MLSPKSRQVERLDWDFDSEFGCFDPRFVKHVMLLPAHHLPIAHVL